MTERRIIRVENGGAFRAARKGDPSAGGFLTEKGAHEINASRARVAAGLKTTVGERCAKVAIQAEERRGGFNDFRDTENLFNHLTKGEDSIFLNIGKVADPKEN
jgi:hypothetical protein